MIIVFFTEYLRKTAKEIELKDSLRQKKDQDGPE